MTEILEAIKVVGFPVIVCLWFMFRQDKKMDRMNNLLQLLLDRLEVDNTEQEKE